MNQFRMEDFVPDVSYDSNSGDVGFKKKRRGQSSIEDMMEEEFLQRQRDTEAQRDAECQPEALLQRIEQLEQEYAKLAHSLNEATGLISSLISLIKKSD